ncbi:metallophosphoesterase family protein [Thiocapsa sp. UBA6158]|jgi:predicted phosphodiesterase|uniref:metallophosphoesterase family protein n=1 Tax=Thiocapsa sp. UBA6158 TaxID=1947692 RepID=UPI0026015FB8|nr:metallophosphoesterase [Thiocapsa sp. UBA6158]
MIAEPTEDQPITPELLTDPYLQRPTDDSVEIAWVTEFAGRRHWLLYGADVAEVAVEDLVRLAEDPRGAELAVRVSEAITVRLSRMREDGDSRPPADSPNGPVERPLWRHAARADGLRPGERVPYRVLSLDDSGRTVPSDLFTLAPKPPPGRSVKILLTSDHQTLPMTPANLQKVEETLGRVDAVFVVGDLVNHPDRASQWFDDARGTAFFPALQGRASAVIKDDRGRETRYRGGRLIQYAPVYTVIGNHEVMGRSLPGRGLTDEFNAAVPRKVAETAYDRRAWEINPSGDPEIRARWIKDNSFNLDSYLELFTLPDESSGGETYWAETFGDIRVVGLFVTQIWRTPKLDAARPGRYREVGPLPDDPLDQGWGQHIFERIDRGSEQLAWLERELASPPFRNAKYRVVLMHHPIHSLGANSSPPFTDPMRIEEHDTNGTLTGVRYEYPRSDDHLVRDLEPLLREGGVQLVVNGHSHLWNRFFDQGVHYLETSNVGNSFGAFHVRSGQSRSVPPQPRDPANAAARGDPNGLEPIAPNIAPETDGDQVLPYIASNRLTVFSILDTADGSVTSYAFDTGSPDSEVRTVDRFTLKP